MRDAVDYRTGSDALEFPGLKVLVAEDEAIIAMDLAMTLSTFGCVVPPPAASVTEALELLERERPDVALLDLSLLDGLVTPLAEALAAASVPFALITGSDAGQIEHPALREASLLRKPYDRNALRELLRQLSAPAEPSQE